MGLLGSALGRGLAGAGAGAAALANKYIDEELAASRAQLMEDLKHNSMVKADQYQNSPERQATLRTNATEATLEQGRATRASELEGLNDQPLQDARTAKGDRDAASDTRRKITALKDMTPAEIAAHNLKSDGTLEADSRRAEAGAKFGKDGGLKLPPGIKAELDRLDDIEKQLNGAITKGMADGQSWEPEKNPPQKQLLTERATLRIKRSQLIAPYLAGSGGGSGGGSADPFKLFTEPGGGGEVDPKKAAILADMERTGVKNVNVQINGQPVQAMNNSGVMSDALPSPKGEKKDAGPSLMDRAGSMLGGAWDATKEALAPIGNALSASLDAHAQQALALNDKDTMRQLLAAKGEAKPLSPAMRARLEQALKG